MNASSWKRVADLSELKADQPYVVELDGREILLLRRDDRIHAIGNTCSHFGAPLNEGFAADHEMVCPWHNARFSLLNGEPLSPPALDGVPVYETRVDEGAVFVRLKSEPEIRMPEGPDPRAVLIVGAGAAGQSAAQTFRREGFAGKILMLTRENDYPYDRTNLSKPYLSGQMSDEDMPLRSKQFYDDAVDSSCLRHISRRASK